MGLLWAGYWLGLSGISMIKGWNNNPFQLANPVKIPNWTTKCYTGPGIFPSGDPGDSGDCGSGTAAPAQQSGFPAQGSGGSCPDGYAPLPGTNRCVPTTIGSPKYA
jgi:hypothetical protein